MLKTKKNYYAGQKYNRIPPKPNALKSDCMNVTRYQFDEYLSHSLCQTPKGYDQMVKI